MNYQHYNARTFFLICLFGWGPVECDTQVLEQDIICEEHDAYIPPTEWTIKNNFTPSDLQSLRVKLGVRSEQSPTLNISWTISADESQLLIIAATLVFAILVVVTIYAMWKSGKSRRCLTDSASNNCSGSPATVLIIYSLESRIFQKAVVAFAEFLHLHCRCKVIIDIWQTQKIAEMGQVQWLATQKETADKIVVICSNSANSKWNSTSNPIAEDYTVSSALEDMYSLTLNMFSSDLKCPAALNKYMVVYFDEISTGKNIPPAFNFCKSYSLMKEIGKICKSMHGAPDHKFIQDTDTLLCSKFPCNKESTQQLRNAILELKEWEKSMLV
ncbi:UNVERIFIED_CONTAM: hypothetical protein FKN15_037778 [Acipenser sinensis]